MLVRGTIMLLMTFLPIKARKQFPQPRSDIHLGIGIESLPSFAAKKKFLHLASERVGPLDGLVGQP
jgi:hypothetical protein